MTPNTPTPSATAPAGQVHTETPWELSNSGLMVVAEGRIPAIADCRMANGHANAAHIVHCVNTHSQLLAQNAELLGALKAFTAAANLWHNFHHGSTMIQCDLLCECIVAGEAAIANASKVSP